MLSSSIADLASLVLQLKEMGFQEGRALQALYDHDKDLEGALNQLLSSAA